ncbi:hypothetical protein LIA77_06387 [Sarocladium implicatum]|nr:hypothetical protein LIA77_06387 [Sarocladium implicatum]
MLHQALTLALSALWVSGSHAQSISLHPQSVPVLPDADFTTWIVEDGVSSSNFELSGLNFTLSTEVALTGGVYGEVYTTPVSSIGERMVGAAVSPAENGGSLKLIVSGLSAGQHRFTPWFNSWTEDSVSDGLLVYVNGRETDFIEPQSIRARNWYEASVVVVTFTGGSAEIVFRPYAGGNGGNIYLAGFEIDGVNPWDSIAYPSPANREGDVAASNGEVLATWVAGREALNWPRDYRVYFGASADELELVATQQTREFLFTGLESGKTYYWRVDLKYTWESDGAWDTGRILEFTLA